MSALCRLSATVRPIIETFHRLYKHVYELFGYPRISVWSMDTLPINIETFYLYLIVLPCFDIFDWKFGQHITHLL